MFARFLPERLTLTPRCGQQFTSMAVETQWEKSCSSGNLANPILSQWPLCHGNWLALNTLMMHATSKPSPFRWRYSIGAPMSLVCLSSSIQSTTVCSFSSRKSPSQRILRLCDFLAEYNFKEIKYVPGPDNVVPDFLSRPWDGAKSHSPFHKLVQSVTPRLSCLHSWQRWVHPSVIVLLSWRGHIALQHRDSAAGL